MFQNQENFFFLAHVDGLIYSFDISIVPAHFMAKILFYCHQNCLEWWNEGGYIFQYEQNSACMVDHTIEKLAFLESLQVPFKNICIAYSKYGMHTWKYIFFKDTDVNFRSKDRTNKTLYGCIDRDSQLI